MNDILDAVDDSVSLSVDEDETGLILNLTGQGADDAEVALGIYLSREDAERLGHRLLEYGFSR